MPPIIVNTGSLSPNQKRVIKDLLIIDDLTGYTNKKNGYVEGYTTTLLLGQTDEGISFSDWAKEQLTNRTAPKKTSQIKQLAFNRLTQASRTIYEQYRDQLTEPGSHADLKEVLGKVETDPALGDQTQKSLIKDILIIDDLDGYKKDDSHFIHGYSYQALFGGRGINGVSNETKVLITGALDGISGRIVIKPLGISEVRRHLLAELGTSLEYLDLKEGLDQPEESLDLKSALCQLDSNEPFCLRLLNVAPRLKPGDQGKTIRITGVNLPLKGEVVIEGANLPLLAVEPGSYARLDDHTATIKISVPKSFPINLLPAQYSIRLTSSNGYFWSTLSNSLNVVANPEAPVVPPTDCQPKTIPISIINREIQVNSREQEIVIIGDGLAAIKTVRLADPQGTTLIDLPVSAQLGVTNRLDVKITLKPEDLLTWQLAGVRSTTDGTISYEAVLILLDEPGQERGSKKVYLIDVQAPEKVSAELPAAVNQVVAPRANYGIAVQTYNVGESGRFPLTAGVNPQLAGREKRAWIRNQYLEINLDANCSIYPGETINEIYNGCKADGNVHLFIYGWLRAGVDFNYKAASTGSLYTVPYFFGEFSHNYTMTFDADAKVGEVFTGRVAGDLVWTKLGAGASERRFRLNGSGAFNFGQHERWFLPSRAVLRSGVVPGGERTQNDRTVSLRGGGFSLETTWDQGFFKSFPIAPFFGWERMSSDQRLDYIYTGALMNMMPVLNYLFGSKDFSKPESEQQAKPVFSAF